MSNADETQDVTAWKEMDSTINVAGVELPCFITAEIECTLMVWHPQNMQGRMEDAIEGDKEVTLDSVVCDVTIYANSETDVEFITIQTTDTSFYEDNFGELEVDDVLDYAE